MAENQEKFDQLLSRLDELQEKQLLFTQEITVLKQEIEALQPSTRKKGRPIYTSKRTQPTAKNDPPVAQHQSRQELSTSARKPPAMPAIRDGVERFIGENLISKVGIAITIIGVGIGARYAIEHQLISPLTRIILGYLFGLALLVTAFRLRGKYEGFSAVLLSGAMAIMYFITFTAYDFYHLIPHLMAFLLMVGFTVFTVMAAISYNQQVIAHVGLVGAYAVPFLLSQDSGRMEVFFGYVAIINAGILVIALKRYWKSLYYASFVLTWLIFLGWYGLEMSPSDDFGIALLFGIVFYVLFYLTFVAYKVLHDDPFDRGDVVLILSNSFIFYGVGYDLLANRFDTKNLLGLFTVANAAVHSVVAVLIHRRQLLTQGPFYLVAGLALVFITIAIPVQLEGNWVTLLWLSEAALLFWVGRARSLPVYEKLSYPLMLLAFFSLLHDWFGSYGHYVPERPETRITLLLNINFLTTIIFAAAMGFVNYFHFQHPLSSPDSTSPRKLSRMMSLSIPGLFLLGLYGGFFMEIFNYWDQRWVDSLITIESGREVVGVYRDSDIPAFQVVWLINYSLVFLSVLAVVNSRIFKNDQLKWVNLLLLSILLLIFLVTGLSSLAELRHSFLQQTLSEYYTHGFFNIVLRYISLLVVAAALWAAFQYAGKQSRGREYPVWLDALLHIVLLTVISSELIHWMDMAGSNHEYKLGLSILWGSYALFVIGLGIWKRRKHLRIGAIMLFAVTLIKLFFYDIIHLNTIDKTIVLVSLGVLLLTISYLYNKYKHLISDET